MNYFLQFMLVFFGIMALYVVGLFEGYFKGKRYYEEMFKEAGIKEIVRCNNSQSNWVEVVWTEQ